MISKPSPSFYTLQQTDNHYLPKFYNWQASNQPRLIVNLDENEWKIIYKDEAEDLSSPLKKHIKLACTPSKENTLQFTDSISNVEECKVDQNQEDAESVKCDIVDSGVGRPLIKKSAY